MPRANPVQKVTIIPRGRAGGYTLFLPDEDNMGLQSVAYFKSEMAVALGGRLAEEIIFGNDEITTGASGDLDMVTRTARAMVMRYGMSEHLGPLVFGEKEELIFLGREISEQRNYGDEVARQIDEEVRLLATEAYERAREILVTNRAVLDDMANALVDVETLEGTQLKELLNRVVPLSIDFDSRYESTSVKNGKGKNDGDGDASANQPAPDVSGRHMPPPLPSS
jgi:cell division protease FtsH